MGLFGHVVAATGVIEYRALLIECTILFMGYISSKEGSFESVTGLF